MQIIGHLGQDSQVNDVNGKKVINFSVAHSEKFKNKDGVEVDKTVWVSCAYWTDRIVLGNYLKKATQVYVEGFPEARMYKNNNGEMVSQLAIRVTSVQLLSSKKSEEGSSFEPMDNNGF